MAVGAAYDAVIVGAGAAGCVVARRLAERGGASVLLVEAGPDLRVGPGTMRDGWSISREHDWGTVAEADAVGNKGPIGRVKGVGGTSRVTRFALRGAPEDYAEWVALGAAGWAFEDVLPAFIGLERDLEFGAEPWHGDA